MALIQCEFLSEVLTKSMSMTVILPQETDQPQASATKKYPVLYLLHGFSDNHTAWTRLTGIERYVNDLGLAVVMPAIDNSYYTDMVHGGAYWTFLTEELPAIVQSFFPISGDRQHTFVAGNSMGGFGALKWGLNCPDRIAAVASLSGVTDMVFHLDNVPKNPNHKNTHFSLIFGDNDIRQTDNDLVWKVSQQGQKPLLYQLCGTEDFLFEHNQRFNQACSENQIPVKTEFDQGDHTWAYWDEKIQHVLAWLPINR